MKNLNGWHETLVWVEKVIKSCTHPVQDIASRKLMKNYLKLYENQLGGIGSDLYRTCESRLRLEIDENRYNRLKK
jgi:hypothetical protein